MKTIKFEIMMDIEDEFMDKAKRWEHHADFLLDLDTNPEIKSIYNCHVTEVAPGED